MSELLTREQIKDKYALEKLDKVKFLALKDERQKLYEREKEIERERQLVIDQSKQRFEAELEDGTKGVVEVFYRGYPDMDFYPYTKKGEVSKVAKYIRSLKIKLGARL